MYIPRINYVAIISKNMALHEGDSIIIYGTQTVKMYCQSNDTNLTNEIQHMECKPSLGLSYPDLLIWLSFINFVCSHYSVISGNFQKN